LTAGIDVLRKHHIVKKSGLLRFYGRIDGIEDPVAFNLLA